MFYGFGKFRGLFIYNVTRFFKVPFLIFVKVSSPKVFEIKIFMSYHDGNLTVRRDVIDEFPPITINFYFPPINIF